MKINVDVECTPEEARTLLGLPDVKPMQKVLMQEIEGRMKKALTAMEPDSLLKMWLPAGIQGLEQWQKFIWSNMSRAMSATHPDSQESASGGGTKEGEKS